MLNVIAFFYNRGINFEYAYSDRNNIITITDGVLLANEVLLPQLREICKEDNIALKEEDDKIVLEFSPYEGE